MATRFYPYSDSDNLCDWCSAPSEDEVCTLETVQFRGETHQRVQRSIACGECSQRPFWKRLVARQVRDPRREVE